MRLRSIPLRLATGAYIFQSGWSKREADEGTAAALHGMAANAYPSLKSLSPKDFIRMLSMGEMAVGTALLTPFVPRSLAGLALTGFGGSLLGLYAKTPGLRQPGSILPSQEGTPIAKDVWLVGAGLSLLIDALTDRG
ncbi:membrane protein [Intrasporangium chromatireducens Q5-1]|uniref:Membrane protein n=1 Tax=Intrasporangium chromatireducens Q5-1 TaxID=584657 RepID=W9GDJ6_9MICO|nr:hypothetical protein [Intrasporangium chromatireducens]EWT04281.1 membrane protein [Intrasporangium chromatireducens Q5-1]